ncbi:MAG: hypothetical protein CM15mP62_26600 [Rhodospirillaceae bacterium]|nr:MAG: hypothetical protein CM15mP62_26600 [Rhodospirillaceae bacterium]
MFGETKISENSEFFIFKTFKELKHLKELVKGMERGLVRGYDFGTQYLAPFDGGLVKPLYLPSPSLVLKRGIGL